MRSVWRRKFWDKRRFYRLSTPKIPKFSAVVSQHCWWYEMVCWKLWADSGNGLCWRNTLTTTTRWKLRKSRKRIVIIHLLIMLDWVICKIRFSFCSKRKRIRKLDANLFHGMPGPPKTQWKRLEEMICVLKFWNKKRSCCFFSVFLTNLNGNVTFF